MGHTAVMIAAVSVATAIICLCVGYFLGYKNVRMRVEDALKKERISADAREYTLRQQLEDKMAETAELRARVEEFSRSQGPLEQLKRRQIKESAERTRNASQSSQELPLPAEEVAPVIVSADERIQNLLKSIEDKSKQSPDESPIQPLQPTENPPTQANKTPEPIRKPAVEPPVVSVPAVSSKAKPIPASAVPAKVVQTPVVPAPAKSAPAKLAAVAPSRVASTPTAPTPATSTPAVKDEWQEFAASLATLTRGKK